MRFTQKGGMGWDEFGSPEHRTDDIAGLLVSNYVTNCHQGGGRTRKSWIGWRGGWDIRKAQTEPNVQLAGAGPRVDIEANNEDPATQVPTEIHTEG